MRAIIAWAIKNSPAMNTLLIASLLVGAVSMVIMKREVFPNFALEILLVTVPFPALPRMKSRRVFARKSSRW